MSIRLKILKMRILLVFFIILLSSGCSLLGMPPTQTKSCATAMECRDFASWDCQGDYRIIEEGIGTPDDDGELQHDDLTTFGNVLDFAIDIASAALSRTPHYIKYQCRS